MDDSRRNFLKVAGASALGVAWGIPVVSAIAEAFKTETMPQALHAGRWALAIDINRCMRDDVQRACIEACHSAHNVPAIEEPQHEVKWIWKQKYGEAFPDQVHAHTEDKLKQGKVLLLCNHCDNPPCVRVCPTQATFKRADGVVMMDQHRCIGCRYCIAACPYGARSFNWKDPTEHIPNIRAEYPHRTKGVVEKCNLCAERLAKGLQPACVDAANRAGGEDTMVFGDLSQRNSHIAEVLRSRYSIRRKPSLGTSPHVFYLV